jgi:hypothetical protein
MCRLDWIFTHWYEPGRLLGFPTSWSRSGDSSDHWDSAAGWFWRLRKGPASVFLSFLQWLWAAV